MATNPYKPIFPWPSTPVFKTNPQGPMYNMIPQKKSMLPLMLAGDGVSNQTKKALVDLGLMRPEDFFQQGALSSPSGPLTPPQPMPLGGDPTRRVTEEQYQRMLREQQKRAQEKYLRYKQK